MANVVYLIIGANRPDGIGFFAVQALLKDANSHVIVIAREPDKAAELNELAKSNGGRLVVLEADVENVDSIKASLDPISALPFVRDHGIDVLWYNAAILLNPMVPASQIDIDDLNRSMAINLHGPIHVVQTFLPLLRLGGTLKKIVYTTADVASTEMAMDFGPQVQFPAYAISKAAANHFFRRLHSELSPEGFTVVCIHPGTVTTSMNAGAGIEVGKKFGTSIAVTAEDGGPRIARFITSVSAANSGKSYDQTLERPTFPW